MHVFKELWPPETRLKNFERSLLSIGVATIGRRVTMVQNVTYLVFRNAPSEDSIRAPFEEVRLIPLVVFEIMKELLLLLVVQIRG